MQAAEGIITIMWFYTLLMSSTYPQEAQVYPCTASPRKKEERKDADQTRSTKHR